MSNATLTRKQTISQFTRAWSALGSRNKDARLASIRIGEILTHRPKDMTVKDVFTESGVTFATKDEGRASRWATVYRVYVHSGAAVDADDAAERLTNLDKAARLGRVSGNDVSVDRAREILSNFADEDPNAGTVANRKSSDTTLISVKKSTKSMLDELRQDGEGWDDLLIRLARKQVRRSVPAGKVAAVSA